ncbi:domain of unknown function DUF1735 [Pedobacter heparinus DSM 2366]|uniref:DUF1735 domain-containing protein n=2 Tax=Pedobacter heparinus TaxID=984 RepID=C6XSN5_PEDHD|nr:domain of unknown function DUF1735 [Pedobacter heparinus DSM 2366]
MVATHKTNNMKKIKLAASIGILMMLAACSKDVKVDLDLPKAEQLKKVYMPQAANPVEVRSVSIVDKDTSFVYSAFLGGPKPATGNITVGFTVMPEKVTAYNQQNSTNYQLMPQGSYVLEALTSVIPAGGQSTGRLNLSIKTKGFLNPFETYLLPVTVTKQTGEGTLNESLATTYYLIAGSYAPGEVPREKTLALGTAGVGNIMLDFDGKLIIKNADGNLLLYPVNVNGTFGTPAQIGVGWNIFNMIFYFGGDRLIARWASGGQDISQYAISKSGAFGGSKSIGQGWGIFTKIIPFKGLLLGVDGAGDMTMYPLDVAGNFDFGRIKKIGTKWNDYKQVFAYQNSLIAIEPGGDMYQIPLSDSGVFGSRRKVGNGWDMYVNVFASGDDLLALDSNGDLWRYRFNPIGFWPLKK